jgi:hypothetical protein
MIRIPTDVAKEASEVSPLKVRAQGCPDSRCKAHEIPFDLRSSCPLLGVRADLIRAERQVSFLTQADIGLLASAAHGGRAGRPQRGLLNAWPVYARGIVSAKSLGHPDPK